MVPYLLIKDFLFLGRSILNNNKVFYNDVYTFHTGMNEILSRLNYQKTYSGLCSFLVFLQVQGLHIHSHLRATKSLLLGAKTLQIIT